jgi:hypothetical protein
MGLIVHVELTRGELVALKETIELTPLFEGRTEARNAIAGLLRDQRPRSPRLSLDEGAVRMLVRKVVVPVDPMSAAIHTKLHRALSSTG